MRSEFLLNSHFSTAKQNRAYSAKDNHVVDKKGIKSLI